MIYLFRMVNMVVLVPMLSNVWIWNPNETENLFRGLMSGFRRRDTRLQWWRMPHWWSTWKCSLGWMIAKIIMYNCTVYNFPYIAKYIKNTVQHDFINQFSSPVFLMQIASISYLKSIMHKRASCSLTFDSNRSFDSYTVQYQFDSFISLLYCI